MYNAIKISPYKGLVSLYNPASLAPLESPNPELFRNVLMFDGNVRRQSYWRQMKLAGNMHLRERILVLCGVQRLIRATLGLPWDRG